MPDTGNQINEYIKVPTAENEKHPDILDTPAHFGYGVRHIQVAIFFICLSVSFIARGHLGVTIVAMSSPLDAYNISKNTAALNSTEIENITINVPERSTQNNNTIAKSDKIDIEKTIYRTYDWPKPIQETVLSSFFLGYCLMAFPIALICQRWGGMVPLQMSLLVNGLVSLMTPWLTFWGGWKALSACRVLQGLSQAGTFPGLQTLLAKWVPLTERATLSSYVYTGSTVGNIIGFQLSGILADSTWGWPATYWGVGVSCLTCFVFLTVFGSATPQMHKTISEDEKQFIMGKVDTSIVQKRRPVPWRAIVTSRPVYACLATHVGSTIAYTFVFTQVSSYIHYILGVDVKNSGILSSLPYLGSFFSTIGFGLLSDYLTNNKILSIKTARRTFNSVSQVGLTVSLICATFATSTTVAVSCFVLALTSFMAVHAGFLLNQIDLSPNNSGTLMAIGNIITNILVVLMPVLVSNVVIDVRNPYQWRIMMCIVAGVAFCSNIVFVIFLSVEKQPWDEEQTDDAELEDLNQKTIIEKKPV